MLELSLSFILSEGSDSVLNSVLWFTNTVTLRPNQRSSILHCMEMNSGLCIRKMREYSKVARRACGGR